MAPPTIVPNKTILSRWLEEGLTQAQMASRVEEETGNRVSRSAIAAAMVRYGLAGDTPRYDDLIPWRVAPEHATAYPLRMLRLLGRSQENVRLAPREQDMLDTWLESLDENKSIVAYDPNDPAGIGFYYIDKKFKDHKRAGCPIREKTLRMENFKA